MKLLVATRNAHKVDEISFLLAVPGLVLVSAAELPGLPDVEEDGATFRENAARKARVSAAAAGLWALADDSGLEVDALDGAPGVQSARYAGTHGDDAANNRKLLAALEHATDRSAQFRCALALATPDGRLWEIEECCRGRILETPRGRNGFGYDPLFVPDGDTRAFAEMPPAEKNHLSHRARALRAARQAWTTLLQSGG